MPCSVSAELAPSAHRCTGPGCMGSCVARRQASGQGRTGPGPGSPCPLTVTGEHRVTPRAIRHHYGISRTEPAICEGPLLHPCCIPDPEPCLHLRVLTRHLRGCEGRHDCV